MLTTLLDVDACWSTFDRESGYTQRCHGVDVWKTADDLRRYDAAIVACAPDVIVETGTRWGGSALWFADHGIDVVTVDVDASTSKPTRSALPVELCERITWVFGDSVDAAVVREVAAAVAGRRCMVSLDSDHHAAHVAEEIHAYGPLVSSGCYLVVEDGIADLLPAHRAVRMGRRIPVEGGPLVAVEEEIVGDPRWVRDVAIEGMSPVSHHPAGWWRRV